MSEVNSTAGIRSILDLLDATNRRTAAMKNAIVVGDPDLAGLDVLRLELEVFVAKIGEITGVVYENEADTEDGS